MSFLPLEGLRVVDVTSSLAGPYCTEILAAQGLGGRNERLVYCSLGSFGNRGPLRERPGYDPLMQAFAGIVSVTGEPDRPGVRTGASLVDQGTGLWAVLGILAALRERDA